MAKNPAIQLQAAKKAKSNQKMRGTSAASQLAATKNPSRIATPKQGGPRNPTRGFITTAGQSDQLMADQIARRKSGVW